MRITNMTVRWIAIALSCVVLVAAMISHSQLIIPSLYDDSVTELPEAVSIMVDGKPHGDAQLPLSFSLAPGALASISAPINGEALAGLDYLMMVNASSFTLSADDRTLAERREDGFLDVHSGRTCLIPGTFPEDLEASQLSLVIRNTSPHDIDVTVNPLVVGTPAQIFSHLRYAVMLTVGCLIAHLTLLVLMVGTLLTLHKRGASRFLLPLCAFELLITALALSSQPVVSFFIPGDAFWQFLDEAVYALIPVVVLALVSARQSDQWTDRPWTWALSLLPLILAIIAQPLSRAALSVAHEIIFLMKPLATVLVTLLCIALPLGRKKMLGTPHHAFNTAFCLMLVISFILDMLPSDDLSTLNALRASSNGLRLLAVCCLIVSAASDYLNRERIIIGEVELGRLLYRDSLSGCMNRRNFDKLMKDDGKIVGRKLLVIVCDVDGTKKINDSFGHSEGDKIISAFGRCLEASLPEGSQSFRIGGDEFVCLVPSHLIQDPQDFLDHLEEGFAMNAPYSATISTGWALYQGSGSKEMEAVLHEADQMMYEVKRKRKEVFVDRFATWEESWDD